MSLPDGVGCFTVWVWTAPPCPQAHWPCWGTRKASRAALHTRPQQEESRPGPQARKQSVAPRGCVPAGAGECVLGAPGLEKDLLLEAMPGPLLWRQSWHGGDQGVPAGRRNWGGQRRPRASAPGKPHPGKVWREGCSVHFLRPLCPGVGPGHPETSLAPAAAP